MTSSASWATGAQPLLERAVLATMTCLLPDAN
jgi:hypothetical protein